VRHLGIEEKQLIDESEYNQLSYQSHENSSHLEYGDSDQFVALTGGEAVKAMLERLDLDRLSRELRYQVQTETNQKRKSGALRRLKVVEDFRKANCRVTNKPKWMVLHAIPVIPPKLRPLVPLADGRFATGDLNGLYRRVIVRNQKVKRLTESGAPEVILRKEKRMLQETVDALLDSGGQARSGQDRMHQSLSSRIEGKSGRLRQNLLGKRVDYSGRSVIVAGPDLKLHQCGLPKEMAVELFKPFIIHRLVECGIAETVSDAEEVVDRKERSMNDIMGDIEDVLRDEIQGSTILLNRQPTLHQPGIQAFQPVLTEGKAIRLHPLVCTAYNADFDGDTMSVHVPLSQKARREMERLMRPIYNVLSPAHGEPLTALTQDMVLGLHYMTKGKNGVKGENKRFASVEEVRIAYDHGVVSLHAPIKLRDPDASDDERPKMLDTTVGRVLFNDIVPEEVGYINKTLTKKNLRPVIARIFEKSGYQKTAHFLDEMKALGFECATSAGHTFSLFDLVVPDEKEKLVEEAIQEVEQINAAHKNGRYTEEDRYSEVIDIWAQVDSKISVALYDTLAKDKKGFNTIYMMADSGARGSREQIRQLGGMRGLMEKPKKSRVKETRDIIEDPILSNFKEGLSVLEYFISTHGARKGLTDKAVKTADAGHLTQRLVAAVHDMMITQEDCGANHGIQVSALKEENGRDIEQLKDRIVGRISARKVEDPFTGKVLVMADELINRESAEAIAQATVEEVEIRSVLTCETQRGVCARCYGHDLTTRELVEIGEAIGVVAAQSIGEPGTQLTLRTFHTGGTVGEGEDITKGLPRADKLFEAPTTTDSIEKIEIDGEFFRGNAHTVLARKGRQAVQKYLVEEIQKVYRAQGVVINDKHIEVIVRRMTERVEVTDPGDTELLEGDWVNRFRFAEFNDDLTDKFVVIDPGDTDAKIGEIISNFQRDAMSAEMKYQGFEQVQVRKARPAASKPVLLGITKAALATGSWLSAASFQETTKVLANVAVQAKESQHYGMKGNVITGRSMVFLHLIVGQVPFRDILTVLRSILLDSHIERADHARPASHSPLQDTMGEEIQTTAGARKRE